MFQERCYDRDVDMNANFFADNMTNNIDIDVSESFEPNMSNTAMNTCPGRPIVEPMQERCINRTIVHEVPHVCPIRTKIINQHVYKHNYRPEYSCCEENVVSNVQEGSCCNY